MQKAKSMLSLHHGRKMGSYRSALFRREEEERGGGGTPGEWKREKEEGKDKGMKEEGENSNGKSK